MTEGRFRVLVMVSGVKVWDPLHAGLIRSRLSERHPASGFAPPCALIHRVAKDAPCRQSQRPTPLSSTRGSAEAFPPAAGSNRAEPDARRETRRPGMKGKRHGGRGDAMMEDRPESVADGPRNAKITLSFPVSAGPLPASLTSSGYCRNSASSSSPHRRRPSSKSSDEGSLWKLDSTTDIKHRPFKPPRHDSSPSSSPSSSSSPMTAHALIAGKDIKSPPPLKCSKVSPETHFARRPRSSSAWAPRPTREEAGRRSERRRRRGVPPPPPPPLPPPPSEGLGAPLRAASYSPAESVEPELICGVCRRLFSSAASLTVHMRLHRGSRALGCRFCGKVFIHSKRLHSHEASCGAQGPPPRPGPSLAVRPKEEPLEEGEVRAGEGRTDAGEPRPEMKGGDDDASAAELPAGDQSHFVKVVDGNVIYFCSVCERSYMTLSSLKRHSNVHSWRRRYPCHFCDKVFALAEYRTKHEVWHTGERRYQCIFCWDAFATYYNLKTHQKAIHGINPSLISSEKTANGGYKQKANALKLYRLLPMRSQKRPYKTYSDSLHDALLMSPAEAPPHPLPGLGCALGPADLQSFIGGARPQSVKPDPDRFSGHVPAADDGDGFPRRTDPARPRKHDGEAHGSELVPGCSKTSGSCKTKSHRAARAADSSSTPSVITYGHPKPSVIVHGTAVSSSVIVHSKQVAPGSEQNELPDVNVGQHSHKGGSRSCKRPRDCADGHRKRSRDNSEAATRDTQSGCGPRLKSGKSHGKNDPSRSEPSSPSVSSPVKETGPLCQITVRIGEEAIVKRSISETDLRRDKSRSPPKAKKGPASSGKAAHHPRKRHIHRRASRGREADAGGASKEQAGQSAGNSSDELREYDFRRKVREQESDHDTEDNLWRPYYSYKPKKKAQAHLQRFKSWQRKLKFKRALRLKRRAERLKKRGGTSHDDEEEGGKPSGADEQGCGRDAKPAKDGRAELAAASPPSPKPPLATAVAPSGLKRRPWTTGNVAECATCGCWFSSSSKRDQHELSHLLEFVCLFCRAAFPSRDKLEDHQRIQHPKPADTSSALQKTPLAEQADAPKPEKELQVDSSHSSPARLSRRALSRHTCPQCHKVCKTSSALSRHIRRHEFGTSPGREKEEDVPPPEAAAASGDALPPKGQVVSVISYSTADPPKSAEPSSSPDRCGEPTTRRRQAVTADGPEAAERADPKPEGKSGPKMNESPVNLTPAKARLAPATPPTLQSVLVMNRPECLDYRTPGKRSLDRLANPAHSMAAPNASSDVPEAPQTRITAAAPPVSMATVHGSGRGFVTRDGVIMDRERQARSAMFAHTGFKGPPPSVQDLQVQSRSRSTSPSEAQDLTMSSILAREREMERQTLRKRELEKRRDRGKDKDRGKDAEAVQRTRQPEQTPADQTALLVPKEEPLSPVPSPQRIPCQSQTGTNGPPLRRHTAKSPCRPALLAAASQQAQELDRLTSPGGGERPSAHALLLPRPPKPPEPERRETSRDAQHAEPAPACYPHQDYPLPLIAPDNYRPAKKQQDNVLVSSYPTGALPFGPLGKMMVPNGADLAKLPFYPDPYQLLYGSQLLAYPYNMAALPVALNMVAPGADKVEPLPFLPAIFNYAAGAGPYVGAAPHPLVANPSFYGGGGKKQRDGSGHKP
ncbi:zinc finger and BTB domain-containing protein 4 [Hippocampus comes]|uniref:zinc finger and BTB domain-containing protein 4 n=1 Tax=Hippocampus comes TaxID=109280 RepID=UPI00094E52EE|nr:PREDICTED: zinc finger and BTB domain-containing protein 4-like [Hippocampus comes]